MMASFDLTYLAPAAMMRVYMICVVYFTILNTRSVYFKYIFILRLHHCNYILAKKEVC